MKCKDIERLIIDFPESELGLEEMSAIKEHIELCLRCAQLQDDLRKIRLYLKEIPQPSPSEELMRRTQLICQAKMRSLRSAQNHLRSIPKYIWVALFSLIVLTAILILWLLKDFNLSLPLSLQTIVMLTLMIQNAGILFFAPLLIRKFRSNNQSLRPGSMG